MNPSRAKVSSIPNSNSKYENDNQNTQRSRMSASSSCSQNMIYSTQRVMVSSNRHSNKDFSFHLQSRSLLIDQQNKTLSTPQHPSSLKLTPSSSSSSSLNQLAPLTIPRRDTAQMQMQSLFSNDSNSNSNKRSRVKNDEIINDDDDFAEWPEIGEHLNQSASKRKLSVTKKPLSSSFPIFNIQSSNPTPFSIAKSNEQTRRPSPTNIINEEVVHGSSKGKGSIHKHLAPIVSRSSLQSYQSYEYEQSLVIESATQSLIDENARDSYDPLSANTNDKREMSYDFADSSANLSSSISSGFEFTPLKQIPNKNTKNRKEFETPQIIASNQMNADFSSSISDADHVANCDVDDDNNDDNDSQESMFMFSLLRNKGSASSKKSKKSQSITSLLAKSGQLDQPVGQMISVVENAKEKEVSIVSNFETFRNSRLRYPRNRSSDVIREERSSDSFSFGLNSGLTNPWVGTSMVLHVNFIDTEADFLILDSTVNQVVPGQMLSDVSRKGPILKELGYYPKQNENVRVLIRSKLPKAKSVSNLAGEGENEYKIQSRMQQLGHLSQILNWKENMPANKNELKFRIFWPWQVVKDKDIVVVIPCSLVTPEFI